MLKLTTPQLESNLVRLQDEVATWNLIISDAILKNNTILSSKVLNVVIKTNIKIEYYKEVLYLQELPGKVDIDSYLSDILNEVTNAMPSGMDNHDFQEYMGKSEFLYEVK